jgi:hypothetical protein
MPFRGPVSRSGGQTPVNVDGVGCVQSVTRRVQQRFQTEVPRRDFVEARIWYGFSTGRDGRPETGHTIEFLFGAGSQQGAIGDAIFHCHLYPHFHEGMWGITRTFDRRQTGKDSAV